MYRNQIILILIFVPNIIFSQMEGKNNTYSNPICYLDSVRIDGDKVFINPDNIEKSDIPKNTQNMEVYFTSKKEVQLTFLNLDDILKKYTSIDDDNNSVLYIIKNRIILDKSDILIDSSFINNVVTINLSDINYISDKFDELSIVKIILLSEKEFEFILRGQ